MLPKITSVTMTANLNCVLNLKEIALKTNNCVYNKTHYDRLLIKQRKPAVTVAIHSSGKLVLTGAKTRADGKTGLRRIGRLIQNLGFKVEISEIKTVNIAATYDYGFDINLSKLGVFLGLKKASLEPELFPNLIWKDLKKTIIISRRGKAIITGCKTKKDLNKLFYLFTEKIMEYEISM